MQRISSFRRSLAGPMLQILTTMIVIAMLLFCVSAEG